MTNQESSTSKRSGKVLARRAQARKAAQRRRMLNLGLIVAGAILIVIVLVSPSFTPVEEILIPEPRLHPNADFNAVGDPNAPVTILVFSDYRCGHCNNFFTDNEQIIVQTYVATGQVYMEFHSFGDGDGNPAYADSARAAQAAYCAGDQGKFFEMHAILFENYGTDYSARRLEAMAETIGIDAGQFGDCLDDGTYLAMVREDYDIASEAGVRGTPSFVVNGVMIEGNDMVALQTEIERALLNAGE